MDKIWTLYVHTNKANNKKYVGITSKKNVKERWDNGKGYYSQVFSRAIKKYGWDGFYHDIVTTGTKEEIQQLEIKYIKEWNTKVPYGYNISDGGEVTSDNVGINVYVYDSEYNFIKKCGSLDGCAKDFNTSESHIRAICNNGYGLSKKGYYFSYTKLSDGFDTNILKDEKISKRGKVFQYNNKFELVKIWLSRNECCINVDVHSTTLDRYMNKESKNRVLRGYVFSRSALKEKELALDFSSSLEYSVVFQYDKNGTLIKKWDSIIECEKYGLDTNKIKSVLDKKKRFYNNSFWSVSKLNDSDINRIVKYKDTLKTVYQYDKNKNLIKIWNNAEECDKYGFKKRSIVDCCNGKHDKYKSFIWSFEELEAS